MTQPASPSTPSGPAAISINEGDRSRATKTRQVHPLPTVAGVSLGGPSRKAGTHGRLAAGGASDQPTAAAQKRPPLPLYSDGRLPQRHHALVVLDVVARRAGPDRL